MTESHPSRLGHPRTSVTQPSAPPIYQTTAFDVPDLDVLQAIYSGEVVGDIYTRDSNPNHSALAESIAAMEHSEAGAVFASGMGALGATMLALCSAGDHVLLARSLYGKTVQLAVRMQQKFGLTISWFDASRPDTIQPLLTDKTRLCLVETVSNPLVEVSDISAIAAELGSVPLVVDSTFTTPELIRPCELGAAITIHSASKYLNGHGDLMLGVAAGSRLMVKRLNETASIFGQNANPFECWLCQRGLRTLPLRMAHVCRSTTLLAEAASRHPAVRRVYHPLLNSHPSYELAHRLYPNGTGGIFSMELNGDEIEIVNRFMAAASTIPFSPTLADARTTMSHPAMTSHKFMSAADRSAMGIRDSLVRISVGLEPVEQLRGELLAALDALG
ncbi:MAG: trans-sulfuration enzyme family protein [Planctomycetota bacterium]